jgi:hypothetical protein
MSSGTLRTEARSCALAALASSSRCEKPASSAPSACASPRPSAGWVPLGSVPAVVEASLGALTRCLAAAADLRLVAGGVSGAAGPAEPGPRRGDRDAVRDDAASGTGACCCACSEAERRPPVARRVRFTGWATVLGPRPSSVAADSALTTSASADSRATSAPAVLVGLRRVRSRLVALLAFSSIPLPRGVLAELARPLRGAWIGEACERPWRRDPGCGAGSGRLVGGQPSDTTTSSPSGRSRPAQWRALSAPSDTDAVPTAGGKPDPRAQVGSREQRGVCPRGARRACRAGHLPRPRERLLRPAHQGSGPPRPTRSIWSWWRGSSSRTACATPPASFSAASTTRPLDRVASFAMMSLHRGDVAMALGDILKSFRSVQGGCRSRSSAADLQASRGLKSRRAGSKLCRDSPDRWLPQEPG